MVPPPPWHCVSGADLPWDPLESHYYGLFTNGGDWAKVWFHLNPVTGYYFVYMEAYRGAVNIYAVSCVEDYVDVGETFDITISEWIGLWPDHECTARFWS